ncbi:MAG: hypothetical protein ACK47M_10460 [Caldilinea sp.]
MSEALLMLILVWVGMNEWQPATLLAPKADCAFHPFMPVCVNGGV